MYRKQKLLSRILAMQGNGDFLTKHKTINPKTETNHNNNQICKYNTTKQKRKIICRYQQDNQHKNDRMSIITNMLMKRQTIMNQTSSIEQNMRKHYNTKNIEQHRKDQRRNENREQHNRNNTKPTGRQSNNSLNKKQQDLKQIRNKFDLNPPSVQIKNKLDRWRKSLDKEQMVAYKKGIELYEAEEGRFWKRIHHYKMPPNFSDIHYEKFENFMNTVLVNLKIQNEDFVGHVSDEIAQCTHEFNTYLKNYNLYDTYFHALAQASLIAIRGNTHQFLYILEKLPYWTIDLYYFAFSCLNNANLKQERYLELESRHLHRKGKHYGGVKGNEKTDRKFLEWFREEYEDRYTFNLTKMPVYKKPIVPYEIMIEMARVYDPSLLGLISNHLLRGINAPRLGFFSDIASKHAFQYAFVCLINTKDYTKYAPLYKEKIFHQLIENEVKSNTFIGNDFSKKVFNAYPHIKIEIFNYVLHMKDYPLAGAYLESIEYGDDNMTLYSMGPRSHLRFLYITSLISSSNKEQTNEIEHLVFDHLEFNNFSKTLHDTPTTLQLLASFYLKTNQFEKFFNVLEEIKPHYPGESQTSMFKFYYQAFDTVTLEAITIGLDEYVKSLDKNTVTIEMVALTLHLYYQLNYYDDFFKLFTSFPKIYPSAIADYITYMIGINFFVEYNHSPACILILSEMTKKNIRITNNMYRNVVTSFYTKNRIFYIPKIMLIGSYNGTVLDKRLTRRTFLEFASRNYSDFERILRNMFKFLPLPYFYYYWKHFMKMHKENLLPSTFQGGDLLISYEQFFDGVHEYELVTEDDVIEPKELLPYNSIEFKGGIHLPPNMNIYENAEILEMVQDVSDPFSSAAMKEKDDDEEDDEEIESYEDVRGEASHPYPTL